MGEDIDRHPASSTATTSRAGRFPAGLSPEEYFELMHISYGSPDEVAERLAGDRVLPLATNLIVQFSPAAPALEPAITGLELMATRVPPALGWKPATIDAGIRAS